MSKRVAISPSMMCADPFALAEVVAVLTKGGVEWLHIDVMDGHYVPNYTLGPAFCRALEAKCLIPLDIHLMTERPDRDAGLFAMRPGTRVTFHPEVVRQPIRSLEAIRAQGFSPGIALDPSIPLGQVRHLLAFVDQVLIMTVNPGYAGQPLLPFCVEKIAEARALRSELGLAFDIEVDGHVSWDDIPRMVQAGADVLVAGSSSIFEGGRVTLENLERMRRVATA